MHSLSKTSFLMARGGEVRGIALFFEVPIIER